MNTVLGSPLALVTGRISLFQKLKLRSIKVSSSLPRGFPGGSDSKAEDMGSIPESERSPGEGNGNPLEYSCLGNPMARGAWQATVLGVLRVGHDLMIKQ